jgi:hypothetical protein
MSIFRRFELIDDTLFPICSICRRLLSMIDDQRFNISRLAQLKFQSQLITDRIKERWRVWIP